MDFMRIFSVRIGRRALEKNLIACWRSNAGGTSIVRGKPDRYLRLVETVHCDPDRIYCVNGSPVVNIYCRRKAGLLGRRWVGHFPQQLDQISLESPHPIHSDFKRTCFFNPFLLSVSFYLITRYRTMSSVLVK
jgi:hypothetical protein